MCTMSMQLAASRTAAGRRQPAAAATAAERHQSSQPAAAAPAALPRRRLLSLSLLAPAAAGALLAAAANPLPVFAEATAAASSTAAAAVYSDADDKFSIAVPSGWVQGSGAIGNPGTLTSSQARFSNAAGLRRVVAWVPDGHPEVSLAITIQFLSPDFTSLGSFGRADDFAQGVVNKMDSSWRSEKEGPRTCAHLVDSKEANKQLYTFTYTLENADEVAGGGGQVAAVGAAAERRTVFSALGMGFNGRANRLFTVNGTCRAEDLEQYGAVLRQMVESFRPPPAMA